MSRIAFDFDELRNELVRSMNYCQHFKTNCVTMHFKKMPMEMLCISYLTGKLEALKKRKEKIPAKLYRKLWLEITVKRTKVLNQILRTRYVRMREGPLFTLVHDYVKT